MTARMSTHRYAKVLSALVVTAALTASSAAQTKITAPQNKYSPAQDVKLGQEAAAEVKKELPLLNDDRVDDYVEDVGRRLAAAIPPEFRHPEFRYTFDVVNQKEINAFALPGGPMFLNRGMIEAAKTEGESGRRHGARDLARRAAPRHRAGDQGSEVPDRRDRRPGARRHRRRHGRQRHLAGLAVRPRHLLPEVRPRVRDAGRHPRRADAWRAPATTRARWRTCSRRSRRRAAAAAPSG